LLYSIIKKQTHLLLRRGTIIAGTDSREKNFPLSLHIKDTQHGKEYPPEIVITTPTRFMSLFVAESFSAKGTMPR
jgi:hypothetical protein